jgi:dTDP-glucose 4,6-dehydratase
VRQILEATGKPETLLSTVEDRPGHDRRYAITTEKLTKETGWAPRIPFDEGLVTTIEWYRANADWIARVRSGEYRQYYEQNYARREEELRRLVK